MNKTLIALAAVASLAACSSHDHEDGSPNLTVTISGEGAALTGFAFPPASANDLAFVDGWDVRFDRILVTVDNIALSDGPDTNPTDQAATGAVLATAKGPWAIDMTKRGAVTDIHPTAKVRPLHEGSSLDDSKDEHAQLLARFDAKLARLDADVARARAAGQVTDDEAAAVRAVTVRHRRAASSGC